MKFRFIVLALFCLGFIDAANAAVYVSGHADLGVGFENGSLHLHIHAENEIGLFGGGTLPAGEYEPGDLVIGVPDPSVLRPAGTQWNFLAANANDPIWFLPQTSNPAKPFLGMGTEELNPTNGWTTPLTWSLNSISPVFGPSSDFAIWQTDSLGNPAVLASTRVPTATNNTWTQAALSHDHFNFGFTSEGIYDVNFTITGVNSGVGSISAGTYTDTASFRFASGTAITAVPEPSGLALAGLMMASGLFFRRRVTAV